MCIIQRKRLLKNFKKSYIKNKTNFLFKNKNKTNKKRQNFKLLVKIGDRQMKV